MEQQILQEDGWPGSNVAVTLAQRIYSVQWFHRDGRPRNPAKRLANALSAHGERLGEPFGVQRVRILGPDEGRQQITESGDELPRMAWRQRLESEFVPAREKLLQSGRARGHALFETSGNNLAIHPTALPLVEQELWRALEHGGSSPLRPAIVRMLLDRLLWECGAMVAWAMLADRLPPNPFEPLLVVYEEGLFPIDIANGEALLSRRPAVRPTDGDVERIDEAVPGRAQPERVRRGVHSRRVVGLDVRRAGGRGVRVGHAPLVTAALPRQAASTSSMVLGHDSVSTSCPSPVTRTSSSIRTPIPRQRGSTSASSGT